MKVTVRDLDPKYARFLKTEYYPFGPEFPVELEVTAHEHCCYFCKHCSDIFYDMTNGPYMFWCDYDEADEDGIADKMNHIATLRVGCEKFEEGD